MKLCPVLYSLALGAALAGAAGCSFVLVHGPPAGHQQMVPFSCTRSNLFPILDALAAGTGLYVGGTLVAGGSSNAWAAPYAVVGGGFVLEGLLFSGSAISGFIKTHHCRAALRELGARQPGAARGTATSPLP